LIKLIASILFIKILSKRAINSKQKKIISSLLKPILQKLLKKRTKIGIIKIIKKIFAFKKNKSLVINDLPNLVDNKINRERKISEEDKNIECMLLAPFL
jgi:hypothetical protein